jgi:SAM-dependent methyltransferase
VRPVDVQAVGMGSGFSGEVAQFYETYRRGYPDAAVDAIINAFELTGTDLAVDLGCGPGQLTFPLAARLRAVIGVDPEPAMLAFARAASTRDGIGNVVWVAGTDADLPALTATLGAGSLGVVTAATALHWMRDEELFAATARLVRPGGGFAVVTNGKPLWQLDVAWSRALREFLESWLGHSASFGCGTDDAAQQRYRDHLAAAGLTVSETVIEYTDDLDLEHLIGGMLSTFSERTLPVGEARDRFAEGIHKALGDGPFPEPVRVGLMLGRRAT